MTQPEQIDAFETDLLALVDRYSHEFDLPYAAVIGVLHLVAYELCKETCDDTEKDEKN